MRVCASARRGRVAPASTRMVPGALRALVSRARTLRRARRARDARARPAGARRRARWLGKAVVLQPEVNGEMTGEVYTWGTALDRRAPAASRARRRRDPQPLLARRGRLRRHVAAAIRDEFLAAGAPRRAGAPSSRTGSTSRASARASAEERAELRARARAARGRARSSCTRAGCCGGRGSTSCSRPSADARRGTPQAHLLIVGSGAGQSLSVEDDLRTAAREPRLEGRVTFAGRVDAVEDYLRASDVFAFPVRVRGARASPWSRRRPAACPSVGSRTGGIVDVIEDGGPGSSSRRRMPARWPTRSRRCSPIRAGERRWGAAPRERALRALRRGREPSTAIARSSTRSGARPAAENVGVRALTGATGYTGGRLLAASCARGRRRSRRWCARAR